MADTGSATWLLVVIAIATSVQTVMLIVAAAMIVRAYQKATAQIHALRQELIPAFDKAEEALSAIQETTERLRAMDDGVRHVVAETAETARRSFLRMKSDWWPLIATGKAAAAAVQGFRQRRADRTFGEGVQPSSTRPGRITKARTKEREDEETRFDYEGGTHARS